VENAEIARWLEKNKNAIQNASDHISQYATDAPGILPLSVGLFAYYWLLKKGGREDADLFVHRIYTGEDIRKGDPELIFRKACFKITKIAGTNIISHHSGRRDRLAWLFKAWNYRVDGKSMTMMRWNRQKEIFPTPKSMKKK
jgi:hypothetical protein